MAAGGQVATRRIDMSKTSRLRVAAFAALALASVPATALGAESSATGPKPLGTTKPIGTIVANAAAPLTYHGGPVLHSNKPYAIYWIPAGRVIPKSFQGSANNFFTNLAADSFKNTNAYSVEEQFGDSAGFVTSDVAFGGSTVDTTPLPANGCSYPTVAVCLTDAQLQTEINNVITAKGWPRGTAGRAPIYFLFTPPNVGSCFDSTATSCAFRDYCAYHSFFGTGTGTTIYANHPFLYKWSGCDPVNSPNGDSFDAVASAVAHEHRESMTDPLLNAWFDSSGNEGSDKCNFNFGAALGNNGIGNYNQIINGDQYWQQMEWSNRGLVCLQKSNNTDPVASFTVSPASPTHGVAATLTATASDPDGIKNYQWTFGDGTSTGLLTTPSVTHTYTTAGVKSVQLVVYDNQGSSVRVTKSITVL
jgi:hypothetical protein